MDKRQHCRDMLLQLCPEMFRPMAEMMIPMVLPDMPEDQLDRIEEKLEEALLETDELKRVDILMTFVKAEGGDINLSSIPPEFRSFLPVA